MNFQDIEFKRVDVKSESESSDGLPDGVKEALMKALSGAGNTAQRLKCLELAVQMPDLTGADEAIEVAEKFRAYLDASK